MNVTINLNDKVRATLTPEGKLHLKRSQMTHLMVGDSGVVQAELWQLMQVFASQLHLDNPRPPFVNMEVQVYTR